MSVDPFSDDEHPNPKFFGKAKFGQPETETEAEEVWEKPSKKKATRKRR